MDDRVPVHDLAGHLRRLLHVLVLTFRDCTSFQHVVSYTCSF